MNIWENTVLTDQGRALQAKLLKGQTLKIKRVSTGTKKVPVVDLRQQTSVTEGGYDLTLQPARSDGDKTVIPVLLENKGLNESYELWQVGFYAEDPEVGEILFCLSQASQAKNIPSETESPGFSITWDFYFNTSDTAPFEVVLDSAGLVSVEQYQIHTDEINEVNGRVDSLNSALKNYQFLGRIENYSISEKAYNNIDWNSYVFLIIAWGSYGNIHQTIFYPSDYLTQTSSTQRLIIGDDEVQIYRKDLTSLYVRATKTNVNNRVNIWGYIHK